MWFRHEAPAPLDLSEGARFRRSRGHDVIETARVIKIVSDPAGIPHVRFSLQIAGSGDVSEEQRTLALNSFTTLYREPVSA